MRGKGFRLKKTGIAKAKKYKNRIYLRKKGNNKNRKKKDFFPPENNTCARLKLKPKCNFYNTQSERGIKYI